MNPSANRPRMEISLKLSSNLRGSDFARPVGLDGSPKSHSPQTAAPPKRIPSGTIIGTVPLEAAKSYPIRIWESANRNFGLKPKIAYADLNTHGEQDTLTVKLLPDGGKTAPHPQIVLYVTGPYHVETLGYYVSDPFKWTTWQEIHIDARQLQNGIDALIRAKIALEAL